MRSSRSAVSYANVASDLPSAPVPNTATRPRREFVPSGSPSGWFGIPGTAPAPAEMSPFTNGLRKFGEEEARVAHRLARLRAQHEIARRQTGDQPHDGRAVGAERHVDGLTNHAGSCGSGAADAVGSGAGVSEASRGPSFTRSSRASPEISVSRTTLPAAA